MLEQSRFAPPPRPEPVVGVGVASANPALIEAFFRELRRGGVAYLVAQGSDTIRTPSLRTLIARCCKLPATAALDGQELKPDLVYVLPRGATIRMRAERLGIIRKSGTQRAALLDGFYDALAESLGTRAASVLIPNAHGEGLDGLRRTAELGGLALTTALPSMPQFAIDEASASVIAPPVAAPRVASALRVWCKELRDVCPANAPSIRKLYERLRDSYGIDFTGHKESLMSSQVAARMARRGLQDFKDYLELAEGTALELAALRDALLVGSTRFFRDELLFSTLRERVFPMLFAAASKEPIRIWVPGCSTGEEAYSLAISLAELLSERGISRSIRIFATDLRGEAVAHGRRGIYPATIAADVSMERLARFFVKCDQGYQVARRLRDQVLWSPHDVLRDPPYGNLDLISCRNLLLYLERNAQRRVLEQFHFALRPGGALLLGSAESTLAAESLFTPLEAQHRVYLRRAGSPLARLL